MKAGKPQACEQCHNSEHWQPSLFNHETQTDFSLKGAHKDVACKDCHKGYRIVDDERVLMYKPTSRECASCHN
jgi:nitrate/TMAO reductase-like tetraheme cytochrome c subunit